MVTIGTAPSNVLYSFIHSVILYFRVEAVQWTAAYFVLSRHISTSSVGGMLQSLNWPLLEQHRWTARLAVLYTRLTMDWHRSPVWSWNTKHWDQDRPTICLSQVCLSVCVWVWLLIFNCDRVDACTYSSLTLITSWRTLIGAVPMVTVAQSTANWCNMHTRAWIAHIRSHTYINTATTTLCRAPAQLLQNLESHFYFEGTWGNLYNFLLCFSS